MVQFAGSVNKSIVGSAAAGIPIVQPVDPLWFLNVLGTSVDAGPTCFDTVPAGFDANKFYYPGLSRTWFSAVEEAQTHRQIQFATEDIATVQLTIRGGISPDVLARWQLANVAMADPRNF